MLFLRIKEKLGCLKKGKIGLDFSLPFRVFVRSVIFPLFQRSRTLCLQSSLFSGVRVPQALFPSLKKKICKAHFFLAFLPYFFFPLQKPKVAVAKLIDARFVRRAHLKFHNQKPWLINDLSSCDPLG